MAVITKLLAVAAVAITAVSALPATTTATALPETTVTALPLTTATAEALVKRQTDLPPPYCAPCPPEHPYCECEPSDVPPSTPPPPKRDSDLSPPFCVPCPPESPDCECEPSGIPPSVLPPPPPAARSLNNHTLRDDGSDPNLQCFPSVTQNSNEPYERYMTQFCQRYGSATLLRNTAFSETYNSKTTLSVVNSFCPDSYEMDFTTCWEMFYHIVINPWGCWTEWNGVGREFYGGTYRFECGIYMVLPVSEDKAAPTLDPSSMTVRSVDTPNANDLTARDGPDGIPPSVMPPPPPADTTTTATLSGKPLCVLPEWTDDQDHTWYHDRIQEFCKLASGTTVFYNEQIHQMYGKKDPYLVYFTIGNRNCPAFGWKVDEAVCVETFNEIYDSCGGGNYHPTAVAQDECVMWVLQS